VGFADGAAKPAMKPVGVPGNLSGFQRSRFDIGSASAPHNDPLPIRRSAGMMVESVYYIPKFVAPLPPHGEWRAGEKRPSQP
jgi:hypothetical protein